MQDKKWTYLFIGFGTSGWIAFIILVIFLHLGNGKPSEVLSKTVVNNFFDSSQKNIPVIKIPAPVTFTVPVPFDVDTSQILKHFFEKNFYSQIVEDSCIRATIKDSISQNKLLHRDFKYQWLKPVRTVESTTVTLTPTETKPKINLYIGGFLNAAKSYIQAFGPEVYCTIRSNFLLKAGYDIKNRAFVGGIGINPFYKHAGSRDKIKP